MTTFSLHSHMRPPERSERARPPVPYPVRDDEALGPNEDLDREPDGIPHIAVGMTAMVAAIAAMATIGVLIAEAWHHWVVALVLAAVALISLVAIGRRARRDRDHVHPSR